MDTKQRILEAAARVFANRGYQEATVREICRPARANVAAVNYHFGGKAALYAAVLTYGAELAVAKYPPNWGLGRDASAADQLRAFVRAFLYRLLDPTRASWHGKLMAREMADPTPALDGLVRDVIAPLAQRLEVIVRALLGPHATPEAVRLHAWSVVGQCLLYEHAQPVLARLYPQRRYTPSNIDQLARHISAVTLAALRQAAHTPEGVRA